MTQANAQVEVDPPKKKRNLKPLIVVAVAALGIGGYLGYGRWKAAQPPEWSGTVEARTIEVGSRAGGRVKEVLVHEGDNVDAGQSLLILEAGDLDAQRLMAAAQLDQAQAAYEKLKAGARPEEIEQAKARAESAAASLAEARNGARPEEIKAAQARLDGAESAVLKAKLDVDRLQSLFDAGAISRAELDGVNTALQIATSQRDAAKASYTQLRNGTRNETIVQAQQRAAEASAGAKLIESGARIEDLRAAESVVKAAEGRLAQIDVAIGELTVKAPAKARVETLDLRPGDLIGPTMTAAVLLEDDQLYVRVYVPETQLGLVHPGDAVQVFVDSFPGRAFPGTIEHIDMQGQYSPRNLQTADERANQVFATRIGLDNGLGELRAGMAATVNEAR